MKRNNPMRAFVTAVTATWACSLLGAGMVMEAIWRLKTRRLCREYSVAAQTFCNWDYKSHGCAEVQADTPMLWLFAVLFSGMSVVFVCMSICLLKEPSVHRLTQP